MRKRAWGRFFALLLTLGALLGMATPGALAAGTPSGPAAELTLTPAEQDFVDSGKTLKVGFTQDRIPVSFSDENGELAGISRYIFDRIQAISGLKFEYVPLPAGDITYAFLQENQLDLVTSVEYNAENQKARGILMSDPYLSGRKVIVAREGLNFSYGDPYTVAIISGSQTIRKVLTNTYPNFTIVDYDSIEACFAAVNSGEVDLMIQNQYVVEYWMGKPAYEHLHVIPAMNMDDQLCFSAIVAFDGGEGTSQETGRTIIDIIDKAIAALSEDEVSSYTIQAVLENQYSYTLKDFVYRYRFAVAIFGISAVVILTLAVLLINLRFRSMEDRAEAKAQGQFLSTMSHEIRTPLNGMVGLNYLMAQKLDDPVQLRKYLRQSSATAEYLLTLVNDILDMSQIQGDQLALSLRPVDLELLVNTVASITRRGMAEREISFEQDISLPYPGIRGDGVRIQQVLFNLLDNARKFTPEGGQVIFRVNQIKLPTGEIETRAEVADTGRGMSEEFQKHVFESFARELDTVSKGNQGTGLGLPISRRLAHLMGGDLTFSSRKGEGSTFVFTFRAREEAIPPAENIPEEAGPAVSHRLPHVLIAEDNELNGEIMVELLEGNGFQTALAQNGREAVELFERSAPGEYGVILMDLLMPEMDGFQAAQTIRALPRPDAGTVRIIACTANATGEDRNRAMECGMNAFLAKPVNVEQLLDALMSA